MNVERINQVADAIEQHAIPWLGFNMWDFGLRLDEHQREDMGISDQSGHDCGTVACVAGWTGAVARQFDESYPVFMYWGNGEAQEYLDLTNQQADELFTPSRTLSVSEGSFYTEEWKHLTAEQAVRVLRHLAATGTVDWSI